MSMLVKPRVLVFCPLLDISYNWLLAWDTIFGGFMRRKDFEFIVYKPYRTPISIADTQAVEVAIQNGCEYIIFWDDDVWDVPVNAFDKLLAADKDMISAVMYMNSWPYGKCAFRKHDPEENLMDIAGGDGKKVMGLYEISGSGPQPVDLTAFPFTLFKVSLFKRIPKPWFAERLTDSYFCQKMLDKGLQPYVDMDIQVNHRGVSRDNRLFLFVAEGMRRVKEGLLTPDEPIYADYVNALMTLANQIPQTAHS